MRCVLRGLLSFLIFATSLGAHAGTKISIETTPERSRNGEVVQYRITIIHDGNDNVVPPRMPRLADFDIINSYATPQMTSVIQNGRIVTRFRGEYVYTLKPLRAGKLKIPSIEFFIGATKLSTDPKEILVDRIPADSIARNRPQDSRGNNRNMPGFGFNPPPDDDSNTQVPRPRQGGFDPSINPRETFFLRAEASKTNVYQGELIVLSYALYQRDRNLDAPEIAKFPDFKGFLKEELVTPKVFAAQPFELNGTMYLRSEIFRYAVFPLRAGRTIIEPMQFRANVVTNPIDAVQRYLLGQTNQMPQDLGVIPMTKSSKEVVVEAKPLPASPPDAQFTGAVGSFKLDVKGPSGKLSAGNPFSIVVTFSGKGNVKAIEAPTLKLPGGFELTRAPVPSYEFHEDATGFKSFDFLIEPKVAGSYAVDPVNWAYFDPDKAQYVTLSAPPMMLQIEGGTPAAMTENKGAAPETPHFSPPALQSGAWTRIENIGRSSPVGGILGWATNLVLLAYLGVVIVRRSRGESEDALYRRAPWERTARRLRELKSGSAVERAILVDEWIRERLAGLLARPDIHGESARDEITEGLKSLLHSEHHRQIEPLKRLWHELDLLRFTGSAGRPTGSEDIFERARALVEGLVKIAPERDDESPSA